MHWPSFLKLDTIVVPIALLIILKICMAIRRPFLNRLEVILVPVTVQLTKVAKTRDFFKEILLQ